MGATTVIDQAVLPHAGATRGQNVFHNATNTLIS
jgi:hypothetical protein